jgi:hypothetical protein
VTSDGHRLRGDVTYLASQPRHRALAGSLERARNYCARQLIDAGWNVTEQPFVARNRIRIPDDGKPGAMLPMRPSGRVRGVNLLAIASNSNQVQAGGTLLIAHLDTVRISPGADDNASGVRGGLCRWHDSCARDITTSPSPWSASKSSISSDLDIWSQWVRDLPG